MAQRTQYFVAASADGYIADADESLQWLFENAVPPGSPEDESGYAEFFAGVGALAMGARSYEWMLRNVTEWPYEQPAWVFTHRDLPVASGADIRFTASSPADLHEEILAAAG